VSLASRGLRDMDTGPETIEDNAELAQVRRQARKVRIEATILAAVLTAIALIIPRRR
jgi:hypothetical protein